MTITPDPIDDARAELAQVQPPTAHDIATQRARLDDAIAQSGASPRVKRRRIRWVPASGIAVAGLAMAVLVAIALSPSNDGGDRDSTSDSTLRLVTATAGGAFRGMDLESASAADVLRAAGRAAADGVPTAGPDDWTFVAMDWKSGGNDFPVTNIERWTSPDGARSLMVSVVDITNPEHGEVGRSYSLHYEFLAEGIIGDVNWREQSDGTFERRATWNQEPGDGAGDIQRMAKLSQLLRDAHDADDVRDALDASIEGAGLEFRDGMACGTDPKYSSCGSSGFVPSGKGLTQEQSKRLYLTGQLLTVMVGNVFPPDATRAIYAHLATLPEATVAPSKDGSGEVILSLRVKGPSFTTSRMHSPENGVYYETRPIPGSKYNTKAVAAIDPDTGRLVELGPDPGLNDLSSRYTEFGVAPGPGVGGELCKEFAKPCEEMRDFEQRRDKDPKAQFNGVVDWMFIMQFCDGMIGRDGKPIPNNDELPRSMSKDPKVKAEREACEKREAAAARGR